MSNVNIEDISNLYIKFGRLYSLIDSIISTLHRKRGTINEEKIVVLKYDLGVVIIKWYDIILIFTPKFYALHENAPILLLALSGLYVIEEDTS